MVGIATLILRNVIYRGAVEKALKASPSPTLISPVVVMLSWTLLPDECNMSKMITGARWCQCALYDICSRTLKFTTPTKIPKLSDTNFLNVKEFCSATGNVGKRCLLLFNYLSPKNLRFSCSVGKAPCLSKCPRTKRQNRLQPCLYP